MKLLLAYSSADSSAITGLLFVGAIVSIAILVWILHQISRQTKGIEAIYELLYNTTFDNGSNAPCQSKEETPIENQQEGTECTSKKSPTDLIISIVLLAVIVIATLACIIYAL